MALAKRLFNEYNFYDKAFISRLLSAILNSVWKKLIMLWTAYIEELDILENVFPENIEALYDLRMLIPMSKVYEFYVFYQAIRAISEIMHVEPKLDTAKLSERMRNISVNIGNVKVRYNFEFEFNFQHRILRKTYRPDIVVEYANKALIIDAKYKELRKIDSSDIHRLLSYVKDFESRKKYTKVYGIFVVRGSKDSNEEQLVCDGQVSVVKLRPSNIYYNVFRNHLRRKLTN